MWHVWCKILEIPPKLGRVTLAHLFERKELTDVLLFLGGSRLTGWVVSVVEES